MAMTLFNSRRNRRCARFSSTLFGPAMVLILAAWNSSPAATLHVAPNGNDAWSGRFAEPNADRTDGPLATLAGARDAVRKLKAQGPLSEPVQILVADGVYVHERAAGADAGRQRLCHVPDQLRGGARRRAALHRRAPDYRIHARRRRRVDRSGSRGGRGPVVLRATVGQRPPGGPGAKPKQVLLLRPGQAGPGRRSGDGTSGRPHEPRVPRAAGEHRAAAHRAAGADQRRDAGHVSLLGDVALAAGGRRSGRGHRRRHGRRALGLCLLGCELPLSPGELPGGAGRAGRVVPGPRRDAVVSAAAGRGPVHRHRDRPGPGAVRADRRRARRRPASSST